MYLYAYILVPLHCHIVQFANTIAFWIITYTLNDTIFLNDFYRYGRHCLKIATHITCSNSNFMFVLLTIFIYGWETVTHFSSKTVLCALNSCIFFRSSAIIQCILFTFEHVVSLCSMRRQCCSIFHHHLMIKIFKISKTVPKDLPFPQIYVNTFGFIVIGQSFMIPVRVSWDEK